MRKESLLIAMLAFAAVPVVAAQDPPASARFYVDSDSSWIRILAWPDGPLKRFGHHHAISHHGISGTVEVAPDPLDSSFTLEVTVIDLLVDDPGQRAQEGEEFEGEVPEEDIGGTRSNMLGEELLNGKQFPVIRLESSSIEGSLPNATIVTTVIVKGAENTIRFPVSIELTDDTFVARGETELLHEAFGLSPFMAMGGALSVRDLLVFKYEIHGSRSTNPD